MLILEKSLMRCRFMSSCSFASIQGWIDITKCIQMPVKWLKKLTIWSILRPDRLMTTQLGVGNVGRFTGVFLSSPRRTAFATPKRTNKVITRIAKMTLKAMIMIMISYFSTNTMLNPGYFQQNSLSNKVLSFWG